MPRRVTLTIVAVALALSCGVASASAWGGGGQGTHVWILAHALELAGNPDWVDLDTAYYYAIEPDIHRIHPDWHLFHSNGTCRGGPQGAADTYYQAVRSLASGDNEAASKLLGQMSHYYDDPIQPFHSQSVHLNNSDGARHSAYELDAGRFTLHASSDQSDMLVPATRRTCTDVRARAVEAAWYGRSKYWALRDAYSSKPFSADSAAGKITSLLLSRAVNDLADVIISMPTSSAISSAPASMKATLNKYRQRRGHLLCAYAKCVDKNGHSIEGARVFFTWPKANGGHFRVQAYTDQYGVAYNWYRIPKKMPKRKWTIGADASSAGRTTKCATAVTITK